MRTTKEQAERLRQRPRPSLRAARAPETGRLAYAGHMEPEGPITTEAGLYVFRHVDLDEFGKVLVYCEGHAGHVPASELEVLGIGFST